jgi:hypothetical protein
MTLTQQRDPFAAIRANLPTRYAPGATGRPYDYPGDAGTWYPVLYYPAGVVDPAEGPIWLVEPYPAERVDAAGGCDPIDVVTVDDPIDSAGITVVRRDAAPRPRGERLDGDWILPQTARPRNVAYDVHVTNQADALAAWVDAYAIAAALNNNVPYDHGLEPQDIAVLLAAERRALTGPALGHGVYHEVGAKDDDQPEIVPAEVMRVLVGSGLWMVVPYDVDGGTTVYGLGPAGIKALTAIRRCGADHGGPRCYVCGCTDDRACPGRCSWITVTGPAGPLCSACPTGRS